MRAPCARQSIVTPRPSQLLADALAGMDSPPRPGTAEWEALKARHVPSYRRDAFQDKWRKLVASEELNAPLLDFIHDADATTSP